MDVLPAYMSVHHVCMCPWRPEEGTESPGTGVTDGFEPHVGAGNLNPAPEEEH